MPKRILTVFLRDDVHMKVIQNFVDRYSYAKVIQIIFCHFST